MKPYPPRGHESEYACSRRYSYTAQPEANCTSSKGERLDPEKSEASEGDARKRHGDLPSCAAPRDRASGVSHHNHPFQVNLSKPSVDLKALRHKLGRNKGTY